jgi:hypothetical protein
MPPFQLTLDKNLRIFVEGFIGYAAHGEMNSPPRLWHRTPPKAAQGLSPQNGGGLGVGVGFAVGDKPTIQNYKSAL